MSVLPALVIALASLLQAAIGGAGLSRLIGYPAPLDNPPGILLYEAADRDVRNRQPDKDQGRSAAYGMQEFSAGHSRLIPKNSVM